MQFSQYSSVSFIQQPFLCEIDTHSYHEFMSSNSRHESNKIDIYRVATFLFYILFLLKTTKIQSFNKTYCSVVALPNGHLTGHHLCHQSGQRLAVRVLLSEDTPRIAVLHRRLQRNSFLLKAVWTAMLMLFFGRLFHSL